jgi:ATP-dependent exoDNAse (exonuclease V) beta subunit
LTRAKRGLYVFLPELPKSRDAEEDWRSLPQLIRRAIGGDEFISGDSSWTKGLASRAQVEPAVEMTLARKVTLRPRATPSSAKKSAMTSGAKMGEEVHLMFEEIAWLEPGEIPRLPLSGAGKLVEDALKVAEVHRLFERQEGMRVYREQAIEVIFDGKWMTGVIDRLLVTRDLVTVIDFKTDAVRSADELRTRYSGQMQSYADAMKAIFDREVECVMVSTKLKEVVSMKGRMEQGEFSL